MRNHRMLLLCLAVTATTFVVACDTGTTILGSTSGNNTSGSFAITPNQSALRVGGTVQLSASVTAAQQSSIEWSSSAPNVAAISPSGLVTAIATGSATITARLSTDTTSSATATITVTP